MKKVSQQEYYNTFMHLDAVCSVQHFNKLAHCEWTLRSGRTVIAKSIERLGNDGEDYYVTDYYINE